ncbi:nitric-oxide reductase large subunit [Chitinophagaceae bacterium LB-8]|uniref:Nitric-oxide reductase large subunit n=1 Tax=Paraflavisolibacter caeni TaxID=2982496 RepID=A0A9X2XU53_9BACT|nr:nitric-oxide reductase large subunit [Paraflavisolibacter caeni]MCU7547713.1 nitric-oxide reductase large subunit [Paraflavisolibacter caeni]
MKSVKRLWIAFSLVVGASFLVLGIYGYDIYQKAPPIPVQVITPDGKVLFTREEIKDGQNVWQSIGGQQLGSVWGHGAYQAPDWSADWLHRESIYMLDKMAAQTYHAPFYQLKTEQQALLKEQLQQDIRKNTYDPETGKITVSKLRAEAIAATSEHYQGLFMNEPSKESLRKAYSIPANTIKDSGRMHLMNAFFFWASWSCVTNRPGSQVSYTQNWPPDRIIGNTPASNLVLWTGFSVIILLFGIGVLVYQHARTKEDEVEPEHLPKKDPLLSIVTTPSMKATLKYFWVVSALIVLQVFLGIFTAHYGVEGNGFYGLSIANLVPYSISRTWHVQLAIFWIATSWLATGLYIAPAVSGYEPKFQRLGVNFLFIALLIIVGGSLLGQWLGVMQKLGLIDNFWFGHQGYEYVDLGRFWQIFLFVGLWLWLTLMYRALAPAIKSRSADRNLLIMFMIASTAIALFYGAGLMWGRHTNLAIAEYWRWWVVHLWVEGFFEVFATVVSAFLFVRMGLLKIKTASVSVLFSTIIFLAGGILGTFHHLYFSGTPTAVLALGATFSALEVVPLVLLGIEAYGNYQLSKSTLWLDAYKWPIYCFIAVAFWNFLGAGIFGFVINPPIALYYMQGLNTTPVHGHTALFGVYGMLGIGLMLFVLRGIYNKYAWKNGLLKFSFWSINIGLLLMVVISVLPVGILQTMASIEHGMWYARSAEFLQQPVMQNLRWMRAFGDLLFAAGTIGLAWFVVGLATGRSLDKTKLLKGTGVRKKTVEAILD